MRIRRLVVALFVVLTLGSAVVVTGVRILEPSGGPWIRLVSFSPYAVVLYALALLLLLVVLAAGRGFWRGLSAAAAIVAVVGLGLHLFWVSPSYVGPADAEAQGSRTLTVMTANLMLGQADATRIVELAANDRVDVLVLEEVTPSVLARMRTAGLDEMLPHSVGRPVDGPAGTMVFSDKLLVAATALPTTLQGYRVDVRLAHKAITLLAVHPSPPTGDALAWTGDHRVVLRAARDSEGPTVIAGDFNATLDHEPLQELTGRGFSDAARQSNARWQPTWPSAGEVSVLGVALPALLQLDHVMVGQELRATYTESVTIHGTDHRAVIARLALR